MSRYHSYLNTAKSIIEQYNGQVPLASWLKDFFRQHKQMGSRDRKIIAELVYCYYRLGHSAKDLDLEDRMLTGLFMSNQSANEVLNQLKPEWNTALRLPINEKLTHCQRSSNLIFPWQHELSDGVDIEAFNTSFLLQPDLFLRVRPGHQKTVRRKLIDAGIDYREVSLNCLALRNAVNLDSLIELDKEAVIQDYNSQRVADFLGLPASDSAVWDCCAASGGKSIMAYDLDPGIRLTVSDVRESILHNLHKRFKRAGISNYESFIADLAASQATPRGQTLIIADLPCSGSGTWARTPENLNFFNPEKIGYYSHLQKQILTNVFPALEKGGQLVYITCSVFKKENEDVVDFIQETGQLSLITMELLKGYTLKADSMFVAVFTKI
ncbi:MAG: Fmu (Sun) domain-containing protein [Chitinophagaceae bacterium]